MAYIAVSYSFSNGTASDATQVNTNFSDIISGLSDGTKDLNMNAATFAGNLTANGNIVLGNATSDTLNLTATLISSVIPNAAGSYDLGSTTLGYRAAYLWGNSKYLKLAASGSQSADWTFTFPTTAGTDGYFLKTNGSGTTSWQEFTQPTIQKFTSGSGTYTTPANVKRLLVRLIGGGGGGGGGGSTGATNGTAGGNSTFGSSLLTAGGGSLGGGSSGGTGVGGNGGTASVTTSATVIQLIAISGGTGNDGVYSTTNSYGGAGGNGYYGGAGAGDLGSLSTQRAGATNTGAGGGAGGTTGAVSGGGGGGAGGYVEAMILTPSSTYSYAVGAGGSAGSAGTSGTNGAAGGSGFIVVEEYYF